MAGPQPASNSGNTFTICVSSNMIDKPSLRCYEINSKRVVHLLNKYSLSICFMLGWVLLINYFFLMPTIFILRELTTRRPMCLFSMIYLRKLRLSELNHKALAQEDQDYFPQAGLHSSLTSSARFLGLHSFLVHYCQISD